MAARSRGATCVPAEGCLAEGFAPWARTDPRTSGALALAVRRALVPLVHPRSTSHGFPFAALVTAKGVPS